eukprot:147528-Chlamydomonas_euryale.AAC.2
MEGMKRNAWKAEWRGCDQDAMRAAHCLFAHVCCLGRQFAAAFSPFPLSPSCILSIILPVALAAGSMPARVFQAGSMPAR